MYCVSRAGRACADPEGRFELVGAPSEIVSVSVRLKGYRLSKKNVSVDLFRTSFEGKIDGDVSDLFILCEPGEIRFESPSRADWTRFENQRRQRLQGVSAP